MNKTILLISRQEDRPGYDTAESVSAVLQQNHPGNEVTYVASYFENLLFQYTDGQLRIIDTISGKDVRDFDGLFLFGWYKDPMQQDIAYSVALYAAFHDVPYLNSEVISRSRTKLSQYVLAALHNLPITPFVFVQQAEKLAGMVAASALQYPLIVKGVRAAKGADNYLVHTAEELQTTLAGTTGHNFVAQHYVPNDGDYRLLVMGGQVVLAMLRTAQPGTHLNNTSQGGSASRVALKDLDATMLASAVQMAELVRREITGVDVIVHKHTGEYFILEVNNMPQLSTGSLVGEKIAALDEYLTDWITRN